MPLQNDSQHAVLLAVLRILKPLARVAIRYGVSANAMSELVRRAYVEAAEQSLAEEGKKVLSSRVCTVTGLYRKEVVRIKALPPLESNAVDDRYNRSARVITGWLRDPDFLTQKGKPRVLDVDGDDGFQNLVKRYSGDMTPRSMLEELQRLQAVEITSQGKVKLTNRAYLPDASELDVLQILGTDTADLIDTIQHNMHASGEDRRFQRKVEYRHIPQRHVDRFRAFATQESQRLLEKLDRWLASHDTESRTLDKPGARLGLGIYQFEKDHVVSRQSTNDKSADDAEDNDPVSAADEHEND